MYLRCMVVVTLGIKRIMGSIPIGTIFFRINYHAHNRGIAQIIETEVKSYDK